MNPNYVTIFDTTLRDGEQSPGATLTSAEKLEIAHGLARLGVDVIEAGFPAASPDDLEAVRRIADEVGNSPKGASELLKEPPIICGLARTTKEDIDAATKEKLAFKAFKHTKYYDTVIVNYFTERLGETKEGFPAGVEVLLEKIQDLRYGENPHQKAAFYREVKQGSFGSKITDGIQEALD